MRLLPLKAAHTPESVSAKAMSPAATISTTLDRRRRNDSLRLATSGSCVSCTRCWSKFEKRWRAQCRLKVLHEPPSPSSRLNKRDDIDDDDIPG